MADDNKIEKKQISVELPEEVAEGIYSNMAVISHSSTEFILDFLRIMPNSPKAKVKSRIILTPGHAKRLLRALAENLEKYEEQIEETKEKSEGFYSSSLFTLKGSGEA